MKYLAIDNKLFKLNRGNFVKNLKTNSLAVFNSNDVMPTSADGIMPFKQQSDIFYLSGIDQEESVLLLFPDAQEEKYREILFLRETNKEIAIWEGHKYTKEEARTVSGIQTVYWTTEFQSILKVVMAQAEYVYLNTNEHTRASTEVETRDARMIKWFMKNYPLHKYERLQPVMHQIRAIKSEMEIDLLRRAIDITGFGFKRLLGFVKPGVMEYEMEAELIHEFLKNRATGFAFHPIIASGANATVLHYIANNQECRNGDLVLCDIGAEYANYNGDLTRCIPVNGRFTKRQKDVYNAVLHVQQEAKKLLIPGNAIPEYHKEVGRIMESELLDLGLLDTTDIKNQSPETPAYKKYFMHGTSHHLGLDVHDYGNVYQEFGPGMVLTVEPGIYIREEGLGIRIENDVVIRETGVEDLMDNIPVEAEEIEVIMNQ